MYIYMAMSEGGYGQIAPHWYNFNKQFNIDILNYKSE